ncbi:MAG: MATE family efflux transporter, partial [Bacteroidota bacterium]
AAESLVGKYFGALKSRNVSSVDDSATNRTEIETFGEEHHPVTPATSSRTRIETFGESSDLRKSINLSFVWGMGLAVVYALIYWQLGESIVALFAPEENAAAALEAAKSYLPLVAVFCLLATPCYIYDGVFVGLTAAKAMAQTMILAFAGYLLTYYLWGQHQGNLGLWISLTLFMVYRGLLQFLWLRIRKIESLIA